MKKNLHIQMIFAIVLMASTFFGIIISVVSCGPSREEIEYQQHANIIAAHMLYKKGDIVYLKPDSCKALILRLSANYMFNNDTTTVVYEVRDCKGNEMYVENDSFIYGKEK